MKLLRAVYEFFRYDLPIGIRNIIYFLDPVWRFQSCDYSHSVELLMYGLIRNKKAMESKYRSEVGFDGVFAFRRIKAMDETINLLQMVVNDDQRIMADEYKWRRLWRIIRGAGNISGSDIRGWWT